MSVMEIFQEKSPRPAKDASMDILDRLHQEHGVVKDIMARMVDAKSSAQRTSLLKQLKKALVPHARAEEKTVYDKVAPLDGKMSKTESAEGYIEHHLADGMIAKLSKISNRMSPEFSAGAKVLKELLEHHIQEEEHDIWPLVQDNFTAEEREEMDRAFVAAKKKVKIA